MKTVTDTRISVTSEEIAGIAFDRYYGGLILNLKDGNSVALYSNDPDRFNKELVSYIKYSKYQEPSQEILDFLGQVVEAATDAVRALEDRQEAQQVASGD